MNENLKNKWFLVGLIWLSVLIINFWNTFKIDEIIDSIGTNDRLRKDSRVLKANNDKIENYTNKAKKTTQVIESLKLGLLVVENNIKAISSKYNLSDLKLEISSQENNNEGNVPLKLEVKGIFKNFVLWLEYIQNEYPYLQIRTITLNFDSNSKQGQMKISLYYKYKILVSSS